MLELTASLTLLPGTGGGLSSISSPLRGGAYRLLDRLDMPHSNPSSTPFVVLTPSLVPTPFNLPTPSWSFGECLVEMILLLWTSYPLSSYDSSRGVLLLRELDPLTCVITFIRLPGMSIILLYAWIAFKGSFVWLVSLEPARWIPILLNQRAYFRPVRSLFALEDWIWPLSLPPSTSWILLPIPLVLGREVDLILYNSDSLYLFLLSSGSLWLPIYIPYLASTRLSGIQLLWYFDYALRCPISELLVAPSYLIIP
ncbi:hypothetical protein G9A89_000353 [Geosiphon pyriformis]|nr:hypothetical protein G9A89_000353 [Geosiphon pyriformis]